MVRRILECRQSPDASPDGRAEPRPEPRPRGAPRELTLRAVLVGCGIGVLLAAGNVYTSIKTGFIDGGSISAALLGFAFFAMLPAARQRALSARREQHHADDGRVGRGHVVRARRRRAAVGADADGHRPIPAGCSSLWSDRRSACSGSCSRSSLRNKLIVVEDLPFPTGTATAEVIETIHAARASALHRARLLTLAGARVDVRRPGSATGRRA